MLKYEPHNNELNPFIKKNLHIIFPFFNFNRWKVTSDGPISWKAKNFRWIRYHNEHRSLKTNSLHENVHRQLIGDYMFYQKFNAITHVTPGIFTDRILAILTNYRFKEGKLSWPTWIRHRHQGMDALMKNQLTMVSFNPWISLI